LTKEINYGIIKADSGGVGDGFVPPPIKTYFKCTTFFCKIAGIIGDFEKISSLKFL